MKITEIVLGAFCFLIMSSMTLKAQSTPILKLLIVSEDNEPISRPELLIEQNDSTIPVSYTHLDVYKRQPYWSAPQALST